MALSIRTSISGLRIDSRRIMRQVDRRNTQMLSRFGAFVRTSARSSLRRTKKSSVPGKPPRVHSVHPAGTSKNIRFFVNPRAFNVIVGPLKFRNAVGRDVPRTMEEGGTVWVKKGKGRSARRVAVRVQPRPFIKPAFDKVIRNRRYLKGRS